MNYLKMYLKFRLFVYQSRHMLAEFREIFVRADKKIKLKTYKAKIDVCGILMSCCLIGSWHGTGFMVFSQSMITFSLVEIIYVYAVDFLCLLSLLTVLLNHD